MVQQKASFVISPVEGSVTLQSNPLTVSSTNTVCVLYLDRASDL